MLKETVEWCKPTRGTKYSACVDLYAREDVVIAAGETAKVPLGVCIDTDKIADICMSLCELPKDFKNSHYLQLEPRSSLRAKGLQAGTGIIDLDFKDEVCIILHNLVQMVFVEPIEYGDEYVDISLTGSSYGLDDRVKSCGKIKINKGERIAQIMLCEHKTWLMGIESDSERSGGFGSTGVE